MSTLDEARSDRLSQAIRPKPRSFEWIVRVRGEKVQFPWLFVLETKYAPYGD